MVKIVFNSKGTREQVRQGAMSPCSLVRPVSATMIPGRYLAHQEGLPKLPVPPLRQTCERYLAVLEPLVSEQELEHTRKLMAEFLTPGGAGERLQKGLERRAHKMENWLSDWWLQTAYLDFRMPVVVHSSPGVVLPRLEFSDRQGQIRFAAKLIAGVLDFKTMIDNETLPVEYLGGNSLCMNQYYQVLCSCRVPGPRRDSVVNHARAKRPPTFITVVHNYQFFVLEVYSSDGSLLTVDQIYMQLEKIWNSSLQTNKEPIGILTSQHRNTWAKAYANLIKVQAIQKSIFTVCLDAPVPRVSDEMYRSRAALQMLHGGGSRWNSGNRWFDKTLQFIIGEDGTCGLSYEHAPAEGPPIVSMVDHVVEYTKKTEMVRTPLVPLPMPQKLRFNITPEIKKDIEKAKQNMNMMYQRCCSTYESASLRMFRLGRTDTIRSASIDSLNFSRTMDDPSKPAIRGEAIDRHLLGLRLQAIEDLVSMPKVFMDTSYAVAMHYNLSTSQVPAKTDCVMCFGPVVPDGYGVCYNPMEEHINFAVSAFNSCSETNAARLAQGLEDALLDMRDLVEQMPRAKLESQGRRHHLVLEVRMRACHGRLVVVVSTARV
ncbi:carnitine O-acetyltransferase-like, partial [Scleropages formosus]